ncbi:uncharacterized protein LOC120262892 [Dioscorea cayenensis subsp. rotundata]|uniref:Uncharacterized protein LOC120262892 n=1 Tax=Dioscorea cayennensis subsp. rotundata TaxID=55577 RepID=A0AB40BH76_DIOCR|nr:uncharacterized protein LOC120262892 [Dioscorea cayenensis subsp. rotundata]
MNMKTAFCFAILLFLGLHVDARFDLLPMDADIECGSCLEASRKVGKALNNLKMFEQVSLLSIQACEALPVDLEIECLKTTGDYIQRTRLLLKDFFHEESLCNGTGVCINETGVPASNGIFIEGVNERTPLEEKTCSACRRTVKDVIWKLRDPRMKTKLTKVLIDYCEESEEREDQCKQTIYRYGSIVLNKLERLKPYDLCLMLGFCDEEIAF